VRQYHELLQMRIKCAVGETVSRPPTDRELRPRSIGGLCRRVGTDHYAQSRSFGYPRRRRLKMKKNRSKGLIYWYKSSDVLEVMIQITIESKFNVGAFTHVLSNHFSLLKTLLGYYWNTFYTHPILPYFKTWGAPWLCCSLPSSGPVDMRISESMCVYLAKIETHIECF